MTQSPLSLISEWRTHCSPGQILPVWYVLSLRLACMPGLPKSLTVSGAGGETHAGECFEFSELFNLSLSLEASWEVMDFPKRVYTHYSREKNKKESDMYPQKC